MKTYLKKALAFILLTFISITGVSCKKVPSSSSSESSGSATAPVLTAVSATFDKYAPADVIFGLNTFGETIESVKEGNNAITQYTYESANLHIKPIVFANKEVGDYPIHVTTRGGTASSSVKVVDTTPPDYQWERPDYGVTYYNNKDFHNYGNNASTIPNQWPGYGIGDPFVMRFNGVYYLYASTLDTENGVRAWQSTDLINWASVQAEGLPLGYVLSIGDYTSRAAYAPEVYYYDGTFYLYTSPGGAGHYVYTASTPVGPFTRATDNFGQSIDGSVLIDDDEQMYFTRANNGGIRIHKMTDMLTVNSASIALDNANIGGWTEGSYILKRDGIYYLTYTGNHVASEGYRVSYAYSKETNIYNREAFSSGIDLPILLNTSDENLKGVGHSSTVIGPDLDSHYIVYHNLNNAGGPNRSFNIERLLFNGAQMTTLAQSEKSIAPKLPIYVADDSNLVAEAGKKISTESTSNTFSAEYNFKGTAVTKVAFNYVDANNYSAVELDLSGKTVKLETVTNGVSALISTGTIVKTYDPSVIHTIRVAQKDNKVDVYFDNMLKIKQASVTGNGGKIGYLTTTEVGYTSFSNVAKGLSDTLEIKQAFENIPAVLYTNDETLTKGVSTVPGSGIYANTNSATLTQTGDYATYLVNFLETGFYGLQLTYPRSFGGSKIGVRIDDSNVYQVKLPVVESEADYVRTVVSEFNILEGINQIRLENIGDGLEFTTLSFFKSSLNTPLFSHDLKTYMARGADYKTIWKLQGDDGHRATAGTRQLVYLGDSTITDFTLQVDMKFIGNTSTSTAGIVFRAGNEALSQHDSYSSIQGYYLSLNNNIVRLEKLNYDAQNLTFITRQTSSGEFFTLKVVARGGVYTVYINNTQVLTTTDSIPFTHGRLGFYTNGAEVCYKNLNITA